jgi:hypothetical protein
MSHDDSKQHFHRETINVDRNKRSDFDYIVQRRDHVQINAVTGVSNKLITVFLHFVPDRYILAPNDGLIGYYESIGLEIWNSPEEFGQAIVDDLNNELVPRWLRLQVRFDEGHELIFEDRQPNWHNDGLLAQLLIKV